MSTYALCSYTDSHLVAISNSKTKTMWCNTRQKWDFIPELDLYNIDIDIVQEMKIVCLIKKKNMHTSSNIEFIFKKRVQKYVAGLLVEGLSTKPSFFFHENKSLMILIYKVCNGYLVIKGRHWVLSGQSQVMDT